MTDLVSRLQGALGDAYRIERELGGGGMSRLFLASEMSLSRQVVVKVLPPELASEVSAARFKQEVELAAHLQHPNIVPVLSAGARGDLLYYIMPYVVGESLRHRLTREGKLPVADAVRILWEVADALAYAHAEGVIHRDIKPENILLEGSHAVLTDFGVARALLEARSGEPLTDAGMRVGTPRYMSPEQAAGERQLDARADVYALAVVGYEMLAGFAPFVGPTAQAVVAAHMTTTPRSLSDVRLETPSEVVGVITRALAKDPVERVQTAAEFRDAIGASSGTLAPAATATPRRGGAERVAGRLRWLRRTAPGVGVSLAIGVVLVFGAYQAISRYKARAPASAELAKSIAVLPFVNISAQLGNDYFSDGMTEELTNALTNVEGLRVASRTSAFAFKGKQEDIQRIAEQLHVGTVLEGSVRKEGDRLRVTAQLINGTDGYHLWSQAYERDLKDVFAVQEDISRAIVSALKIKLVQGANAPLVRPSTSNVKAYDLYLKGRYFWNRRTEEGLRRGAEYFEQAIAVDPHYSIAYSGLADTYTLLGVYSYLSPKQALPKARAAAERALETDDSLAEGHASLAHVKMVYDWDWPGALREFQRAIELNPRYATAHQWYALCLTALHRLPEATAEARRAQELDPLSLIINTDVGLLLYLQGQLDQAIEQFQKTLELNPDFFVAHFGLALAYEQKGNFRGAVAELETATTLSRRSTIMLATLGHGYAVAGRRADALRVLNELEGLAKQRYVSPYGVATIYAGLGENDQAFRWLQRAYEDRSVWLIHLALRVDPRLGNLRSDPRFIALLKKIGLD